MKSMPLKWLLSFISVLLMATTSTVMGAGAAHGDQAGITWTSQATTDTPWDSVTYGNGLFVAVAYGGTSSRVMTSPDGITWTTRTSAADNMWEAVTYGNGLFVAVAIGGSSDQRVMTSPDGITWTGRTSPTNAWTSVTYGNGLFVAVGESGDNRVMTSPDGITWTIRASAFNYLWYSVTYADGKFVAVSSGPGSAIVTPPNGIEFIPDPGAGPGNVMTSPDGITWTLQTSAPNDGWHTVAYGGGIFVSASYTGTGNVMTSPDGITWTMRPSGMTNKWHSVTYGDGLFVAVAVDGTGNRVMTSPDGITWTSRTSAADNAWHSVTYANGLFVAVAYTGTGNRVMTSGRFQPPTPSILIIGSRDGERISVTGTSMYLTSQTVRPWIRFADQTKFTEGVSVIPVTANGTFAWSRKTGKKAHVYVADGATKSNTVVIPAR